MAPGSLPGVMQDAINTDASFPEKEMRILETSKRIGRWYGLTTLFIGTIFGLGYGLGTTIMAVL